MSTNYRIIEHEISKFGKLEVVLHKSSKAFYDILEEHGIVNHLKRIDQLGFISKSHPGNNHKRWDYVCLQLYFLHRLKHATFREGLNSANIKGLDKDMSRLELLQIAVLFSSIGHLKGSLASEIAFFQILNENPTKKAEFLKPIQVDNTWDNYIKNIFENYDYYKVKNLIGLNFVKNHLDNKKIEKAIEIFFKNALEEDRAELRRLKLIFLRIRQISFVYLDSFNSDFPFQIDISKVLLNIFNYNTLFNPNSSDFASFLNECETSLSTKLYISAKSCELLEVNREYFKKEFAKSIKSKSKSKLDFKDFLKSFTSQPNFEVLNAGFDNSFQYYISKEDINLFYNKLEFFDYNYAQKEIHGESKKFLSVLRKKLKSKNDFNLSFIHDQRKSQYYLNLYLKNNAVTDENFLQFLHNYFSLHKKFLSQFKLLSHAKEFDSFNRLAFQHITQHYCRKVFLQLFKILFENDKRLNAYIKFDNQVYIQKLIQNKIKYPTGYIEGKKEFLAVLEACNDKESKILPKDLRNNIGIATQLVKDSKIRNMKAFYCLFPVELVNVKYDIKKHYECQNPETADQLTDIDLCMVLFNDSSFEFYLIEGKDKNGFRPEIEEDFQKRIKPNFNYQSHIGDMNPMDISGARGGYIKITSQ
ncbi:MAG: hypothetical protein HUJ25_01565 [Crocinitomicaceae bacterium]|nr:hypothetical protein [Crocinitomicaceae bacterium]